MNAARIICSAAGQHLGALASRRHREVMELASETLALPVNKRAARNGGLIFSNCKCAVVFRSGIDHGFQGLSRPALRSRLMAARSRLADRSTSFGVT